MSKKEVQDLTFEVSLYFYMKQANQRKSNLSTHFRSSRSQMFFRIGVLKNFAIFTGCNDRLQQGSFPVNNAKFLRTAFL